MELLCAVIDSDERGRAATRAPVARTLQRSKGSKVHVAVDTLGHLLALKVTPVHQQDRAQVEALAQAVQ